MKNNEHIKPLQRPTKNNTKPVIDLVVKDLKERSKAGEKKYGTKLQVFNGRNGLHDLY